MLWATWKSLKSVNRQKATEQAILYTILVSQLSLHTKQMYFLKNTEQKKAQYTLEGSGFFMEDRYMEMETRGKRNQLDKRAEIRPGQTGCYVINRGVWWTRPSAPKLRNGSKKRAEKTDKKTERIREREGGK